MTDSIAKPMQITEIRVKDLFGKHSYSIPLNRDGVTLIHGPNGVGKTTILKLVDQLFRPDWRSLSRAFFDEFSVVYADGAVLTANSLSTSLKTSEPQSQIEEIKARLEDGWYGMNQAIHELLEAGLSQVQARRFIYQPSGPQAKMRISLQQTGEQSRDFVWKSSKVKQGQLFDSQEGDPDDGSIPQWLRGRIDMAVQFIGSQRLVGESANQVPRRPELRRRLEFEPTPEAIISCASKLRETLRECHVDASEMRFDLDSTFAQRLLEAVGPGKSEQELRQRYEEMRSRWGRVRDTFGGGQLDSHRRRVGRLDRIPETLRKLPESLDAQKLTILDVYLNDMEEKFKPFESLLQKVEVFQTVINDRFHGKSVRVDPDDGLAVYSESDQPIPLTSLSSGEKHEIVLTHKLLFDFERSSLVMIDEPEISLHVTWQQEFLGDLDKIREVTGHSFLIATHSPSIVGEHWDRIVEMPLEEGLS